MIVLIVLVVVLVAALGAVAGALAQTRRQLVATQAERDALAEQVERLETRPAGSRRRSRALRTVMETAVESANRLREGGVAGLLASSIDDLTRWASEDREIERFTAEDGTITVLFSDIENSTALNEQLGDEGWVRILAAHDALVQRAVEANHGHIVKSQGDGFMVVFRTSADAVRCGIAMQDAFESNNHRALRRTPIRVRVGIHTGTVVERDGDFFGTNVAMAARVAAQAEGGEILVSDDVRQALREIEDIVLIDFREAELKGLPGVHRLWEVGLV